MTRAERKEQTKAKRWQQVLVWMEQFDEFMKTLDFAGALNSTVAMVQLEIKKDPRRKSELLLAYKEFLDRLRIVLGDDIP